MRGVVYRAERPVPEIGCDVGDLIVVDLGHPSVPVLVVKEHGYDKIPALVRAGVILSGPGRGTLGPGQAAPAVRYPDDRLRVLR